MNRIVEQLLRVARLDAVDLDVSSKVDLNPAAESVVSAMAPLASGTRPIIAFSASEEPILVKGNAHAIGDAIRNLVENAIGHSPREAEVTVSVLPGGSVSVVDQGPGISAEDRDRIFERFWRGKGVASGGSQSWPGYRQGDYGGARRTDQRQRGYQYGGSVFTLYFPPVDGCSKSPPDPSA